MSTDWFVCVSQCVYGLFAHKGVPVHLIITRRREWCHISNEQTGPGVALCLATRQKKNIKNEKSESGFRDVWGMCMSSTVRHKQLTHVGQKDSHTYNMYRWGKEHPLQDKFTCNPSWMCTFLILGRERKIQRGNCAYSAMKHFLIPRCLFWPLTTSSYFVYSSFLIEAQAVKVETWLASQQKSFASH